MLNRDLDLADYRKDPCGLLPIPLWKLRLDPTLWDMDAVHVADPSECLGGVLRFRVRHPLTGVEDTIASEIAPGYRLASGSAQPSDDVAAMISACLEGSVTPDDVAALKRRTTFRPSLWVSALDDAGQTVGFGLAESDQWSGEGSIEWIHVNRNHWGRGVGRLLVNALLGRLQDLAAFATGAGRVDNPRSSLTLFRACGFTGDDLWCVRG